MNHKEVMQIALEALEMLAQPTKTNSETPRYKAHTAAITALRTALAQQEPVTLPCCGYTDASAIKWNRFNGVVQCHNCGQVYAHPPRREWVSLTEEEVWSQYQTLWPLPVASDMIRRLQFRKFARAVEQALKERNNG
jgi:hypothetical protein